MTFTLAIIGRPNVGKSTLFNRLVGKRLALVDDRPGVTRDLREGEGRLGPLRFTVVDTAGLEEATDDSLQGRMRRLTERAVDAADVCLFMIDARAGVTAADQGFAELLRKKNATVILAANKTEGKSADEGYYDAFSLGLGEPVSMSAEHNIGMDELRERLMPFDETPDEEDISLDPDAEGPIQIAIVGRPNAGKSTLVNEILGQDRMLTGPEAGITRDAIGVSFDWGGQPVKIFDTAGMRKKAKVNEKLEKMSVQDGLRAFKFAEVVVVLIDAQAPLETQDLRIADLAEREGRAIVIGVNKWDLIDDKPTALKALKEELTRLLPQMRGVPMVTMSAVDGRGVSRLREAILDAHRVWNIRISTARLNRWLGDMVSRHPPPAPGGRRIKLRYMTQAKARPPTFILFTSRPEDLPTAYTRYLVNGMREEFALNGTPIRLLLRKGDNPFAS
jgi:GTP-binding protein